eukprot:CAMPEP_0201498548 /NCGR_PEP_ID=MMETSP0151_2-20130828/71691_1 /ASSEMBLY_ACC=CAM_ASM_000257 /TAXON_ID=200890 /ORGANISM="Paramoeba atlantica, Strain 621/1 / CCAP 1560/9" /LENGTH=330 /DNA_ID=CAMNT_0047890205 /DNA_START=6 /DNA_END=995 /DNA_ORIENTATION=-
MQKYNHDVDMATKYLFEVVVPRFADSLCESFEEWEQGEIVRLMHRAGINLRYIGLVIKSLDEFETRLRKLSSQKNLPRERRHRGKTLISYQYHDTVKKVNRVLLIEAVARVIKNELNRKLREKVKELKLPLEVPYRQLAINFLNLVFGASAQQMEWWKETLPSLLSLHFNIHTVPSVVSDIRWEILFADNGQSRLSLFRRVIDLTGLVMTPKAMETFQGVPTFVKEPVSMLDVLEMGDRVKSMDIVSLSQGNFLLFKSLGVKDRSGMIEMLEQAIERYEVAVNTNASKETLRNCSLAYYRLILAQEEEKREREITEMENASNVTLNSLVL